jgi:hypothetical protein
MVATPAPLANGDDSEEALLLQLIRMWKDLEVVQEPKLLTMLGKLREKCNNASNILASQLLELIHKRGAEIAEGDRKKIYECLVLPGKNWWYDHKKDRAALRAKYHL